MNWHVHQEFSFAHQSTRFWLIRENDVRREAVEFVFHPFPEGGVPVESSAKLDQRSFEKMMQAFLDTAWGMGLRPKGFADTEGTLSATRAHLEDMRLLAGVRK